MDVTLRDESIKRLSRRVLRHRWQRIVAGLACVVVFCTTYALILPAITLTRQAYCGIEEHTHSDACYEQVLVCGQDESDGHTHTDACYASEQVLVCGLEETEGHVHDDGCYQTETYLTCGLEETEGHVHTDACYERQMTCGKNEHTHTLQCYSNPDADVETEADWKATLPKLTDNWNDDVVAVALSQAGYRESLYNYEVQADDVTTNGYTRFGAWYGDVYGDWTAMFASFCTYYAEVPMPIDANLGRYMQKLADEHLWHAASEADYEPKPGSLVFLDTEDPDDVDRVGVLIKVEDDRLTLLVGDYNNKVDKLELVPNDPMIEGYAQLPEQPSEQVAEVAEPEPEGKPETAPKKPNADDSKAEEPKADDPKAEDPKSEESADETQEPGSDKDKPADETQAPASDADKPEEAGVEKPTEPESGSEDLSGDANTLTFSGSDYTVTVGYTEKAEIPEDATLAVSEVYAGGVAYNDYLHDAKAALGIEDKRAEARFFDIKIMDGETEVKPAKPVTVTIAYDELPQSADATKAEAVHFVATGAEVMNAEATAEGDGAQVTFDAPSFSVYGVVYTVDFEYELDGKVYQFSLKGGEKIALSELVEVLGVLKGTSFEDTDAFLADVQDVSFSDETLVKVSKNLFGNDWTLQSLQPFDTEEELAITMKTGEHFVVKVTDDQNYWTVNVNLYDYDGETPATQAEVALLNGKSYGLVAVITDKTTNEIIGYKATGVDFKNGQPSVTGTIGLDTIRELRQDASTGKYVDTWQTLQLDYDPSKYDVSIRLYEADGDAGQWPGKSYADITRLPAYADGYEFLAAPNGNVQDVENRTNTLNMKRAYDKQFNIRLEVDPAGLEVSESDKYYALVTVEHETTGTTYAYAPVTIAPDQSEIVIPITGWYDQNGGSLPNEKFTGNERVKVELYTTNKDGNGNKQSFNTLNEIKNSQTKVLVKSGDSVNRYNVDYGDMRGPYPDDATKKSNYYSTIYFHAPNGTISKGDLDRILDDATDFGYYTERYVGHAGDIEATIGADYLDTTFESDFGYSSANVNVNRLKVLKLYTDGDGNPVQKEVTVKLKRDGVVVAEKTGTTGADGKLELEFEGLGSGEYDIVEVIDGQEVHGAGSATVSGQTINYNFSIDKAHFANNLNINYFGTIGEGMDVDKLKTMVQKSSRVDVVILTDTQADKDRIDQAVLAQSLGKKIDVVINGTAPYKHYDIKEDMVQLRQLSDDLAASQSSDTIRVVNVKASEIPEDGMSFDDDGRYIVLNITMDRDTFCPRVLLDGQLLDADYGQSGKSNSSKVLYNLRNTEGGRYEGDVNTSKVGAGIILAPDANAHILGGPFGGTIITNRVNRAGNELHSNNPNQIQTLNAVIQNVVGQPQTGMLQLSKKFADSTKDKVTYFTFKVKLSNADSSKVNGVSFPASGLKSGNSVTFDENGEALVQVRAGNTVSIANLPNGTTYTVEEVVTPETAHFHLDHIQGGEGTIHAGQTSTATVYNITLPLNAGFAARKTVGGQTPGTEQRYDFKLDEYTNGAWKNTQTQPNVGEKIAFEEVQFNEAGTYFFKIYEDADNVTDVKPDHTVYVAKVEVKNEAGELEHTTTYYQVKDSTKSIVSGDGLGTLDTTNVEPVELAWFDNKDQVSIKKVWDEGKTGGNTQIAYTLYRTTTKPEYVNVKVAYPVIEADDDGTWVQGTATKTYRVMKGSELRLLTDHVASDDSANYSIAANNGLAFAKEGSAKTVTFNHVSFSESAWKATVPANASGTYNVTVSYGNNADVHEYLEPIMEVAPPAGAEPVGGYVNVSLKATDNWFAGINGLDEADASGNPYYYYVYEESLNAGEGENLERFEATYSLVNKTAADGEELTITNRMRPAYTWVEVTKEWPEGAAEIASDDAEITVALYRRLKGTDDRPQRCDSKTIKKGQEGKLWTAGWYVLDSNYEYFVQELSLKDSSGIEHDLTAANAYTTSDWGAPSYTQGENQLHPLTGLEDKDGELYYKVDTADGGTVTIHNDKRETHLKKVWVGEKSGKIIVDGTQYDLSDLEVTVQLRQYVDGVLSSKEDAVGRVPDALKSAFDEKTMDGVADAEPTDQTGFKCYEDAPWSYVWKGLPDHGVVDGKTVFYTYDAVETSVKTKSGNDLTEFFTQKSSDPDLSNISINNTVRDDTKAGIQVEKKWYLGETEIDGGSNSATVQLRRYHYTTEGGGSSAESHNVTVYFEFPEVSWNINNAHQHSGTVTIVGSSARISWRLDGESFYWDAGHTNKIGTGTCAIEVPLGAGDNVFTIYGEHDWAANSFIALTGCTIEPAGDGGSAAPELKPDTTFPAETDTAATQVLSSQNLWRHKWTIGDGDGYDFPATDGTNLYYYYLVELKPDGTEAVINGKVQDGITLREISYNPEKSENAGIQEGVITVKNEVDNTPTEFEFSKVWKLNGQKLDWQTPITVTLNAYTTDPNKPVLGSGTQYTLSPDSHEGWEYIAPTGDSKVYTFRITGLNSYHTDGSQLHYYVQESPITDFTTTYALNDGEPITGATFALDGQQVVNTQEGSYEMPSTGGPGTMFFNVLGSALIVASSALLLRRRRALEGGGDLI